MRALILVFALILPSFAQAQSVAEPRSWTATPFLSVTLGTSGDTSTSSLGVGAAVGYDWTANLGFEGEIGRVFDIQGDFDAIDWSLTTFSANVVYHFDVRRVTPYATAGLGLQRSGVDLDPADPPEDGESPLGSDTEVTFNFGGGVKYRLANNV